MRIGHRSIGSVVALVLVATMPACGGGVKGADGSAVSSEPTEAPEVRQGMFDVGGHGLYLRCEGSGSPTVVYLHGLSHTEDGGQANSPSAGPLPALIAPKHQFCTYDRANVGQSDDVAGPLTAKTSVRDLERLVEAADLNPRRAAGCIVRWLGRRGVRVRESDNNQRTVAARRRLP